MKKFKVIDRRFLPTRFPFQPTMILIMAMRIWDIPQILLGILWTLCAIVWIGVIICIYKEDPTDIKNWNNS